MMAARHGSRHGGGFRPERRPRQERKTILIVCEGEKTEKLYFEAFRRDLRSPTVSIKIVGAGRSYASLVEKAEALYDRAKSDGAKENYDEVWCVFDNDGASPEVVQKAFAAKPKGKPFHLAYSNAAFELWYVLHFCYWTTPSDQKQLEAKCNALFQDNFGRAYDKTDERHFELLKDRQATARQNSERLLAGRDAAQPFDNPGTSVHLLIDELNKLRKA